MCLLPPGWARWSEAHRARRPLLCLLLLLATGIATEWVGKDHLLPTQAALFAAALAALLTTQSRAAAGFAVCAVFFAGALWTTRA
jgi:hypothetical protein